MSILEKIKSGNWPLLKVLRLRLFKKDKKNDVSKKNNLKGDTNSSKDCNTWG